MTDAFTNHLSPYCWLVHATSNWVDYRLRFDLGWKYNILKHFQNIFLIIKVLRVFKWPIQVLVMAMTDLECNLVSSSNRGYQHCPLSTLVVTSQFSSKFYFTLSLSCNQAALWMVQSVRPSICLSVTHLSLIFDHRIIMTFSGVITIDSSDVHAKGQGQSSRSQRSNFFLPNLGVLGP